MENKEIIEKIAQATFKVFQHWYRFNSNEENPDITTLQKRLDGVAFVKRELLTGNDYCEVSKLTISLLEKAGMKNYFDNIEQTQNLAIYKCL